MDKQAAVNIGYQHFITEGWGPSLTSDGNFCCYRAPDGNKCNAGLLIPDDVYDGRMEQASIGTLLQDPFSGKALAKSLDVRTADDERFLTFFQGVHDQAADKESVAEFGFHSQYERRLRELCRALKLQYPGDMEAQPNE